MIYSNLNNYIDFLYKQAINNITEYIEMKYIQNISKSELNNTDEILKVIDDKLIEDYLKKRGYTMNYILQKRVMVKDFTCVYVYKNYIEIWHDKIDNNKSIFIKENYLTSLPITLNYMETI